MEGSAPKRTLAILTLISRSFCQQPLKPVKTKALDLSRFDTRKDVDIFPNLPKAG